MPTLAETLTLARQVHQAGDPGRAEPMYRQVLQADPANTEALHLLGLACYHLNRPDEAVACFEQALRLRPDFAAAHNNLGNVLSDRGDAAGAADHYRQALRLQPGNVGMAFNLGNALQRQADLAGAAACFRRCLQLQPGMAAAHFCLGTVQEAQGQRDEAAGHYREALRLKPDYAEAHNNLGNVLLAQGRADEAVAHYREAVRLRPAFAEAHYNLGNACREHGEVAEGAGCYEQALRLRPDFPQAHNNLGEALLELGRVEEARAHFQEALRLNPNSALTVSNLATHGFYPSDDEARTRLRDRLADPRLAPADAVLVHFALANLLDQAGACDEAFAHFRQGNDLRRSLARQAGAGFDAAAHERLIDRLIAAFTPAYFRRVQGFGSDSEVPLFVVGVARSGTTLVEQILSCHPQVLGAGELPDVHRLTAALPAQLGTAEGYPECLAGVERGKVRALAERHLRRLTELGGAAARVADKWLENYLHLGLIATLFRRARVIHCRRDPLDVCLSCYCHNFTGLNYAFSWDLHDLGRYYRAYERLTAHWRDVLPLRVLEVAYEDLVADQEAVSRRLVAFCGLEWDERCLRFPDNPRSVRTASKVQVRRPIYTSSVGRWRRYAAHLRPLREALGEGMAP
jgi:tetratricopeptide (TPR) repeat protein